MTRTLLLLALGLCLLGAPLLAQEGRPQFRVDDPLAANTPDGFDIFLDGDGDLWVAMWLDERDPVNTFDDDIWIAISQDGGITFGSEIQVTAGAVSAIDVDDAYLEVDDGNIYITYDDDAIASGTPQAMFTYSTDLGASFTTVILDTDGQNPRVQADGSNIAIVWYNDLATPNPLKATTSTTGPGGILAGSGVVINGGLGDIDGDGFELVVSGDTAHVAYFDDTLLAFEDDYYYVSHDFVGGLWSAPLQVNDDVASPLGDVDTFVKLDVDGDVVHFAWNEDDVDPLNSTDDVVFYRNYNTMTATFSTELQLSPAPPVDTDFMWMDADGSNVLVAWTDDGGTEEPTVAVSNDGGASFATQDLTLTSGGGPLTAQHFRTFVDGDLMYLIYEDDSRNAGSLDETPSFHYSNDGGTSWNGPFALGSNFEADEDIDTEGFAWFYDGNNLGGIWQTDGGVANPDAILGSGIRFPYVTASHEPIGGTSTLTMVGNPVSEAGDFARWAASLTLGTQVHPENAALTVDLGPSFVYTNTTKFPPIPPTTTTVAADGSATLTLVTGAIPSGAVIYVQGWTNFGSLTGGREPGDVFTLTIP